MCIKWNWFQELLEWNVIKVFGQASGLSRTNTEFPQPLNAGIATTAAIPQADAYFLEVSMVTTIHEWLVFHHMLFPSNPPCFPRHQFQSKDKRTLCYSWKIRRCGCNPQLQLFYLRGINSHNFPLKWSTQSPSFIARFGQLSQEHLIYEVRYGLREALLGAEAIGGGQVGYLKNFKIAISW